MNNRLVVLVLAFVVVGCTTIRRIQADWIEEFLAAAGFEMRPADTVEQQQHLAAMTPYRLERRTEDGRVIYTYADPDRCKCLYVGGPEEYSEYQRQRAAALASAAPRPGAK